MSRWLVYYINLGLMQTKCQIWSEINHLIIIILFTSQSITASSRILVYILRFAPISAFAASSDDLATAVILTSPRTH